MIKQLSQQLAVSRIGEEKLREESLGGLKTRGEKSGKHPAEAPCKCHALYHICHYPPPRILMFKHEFLANE